MDNLRYAPGTSIPTNPYWPGVNQRDPDFHPATSPTSEDWRQDLGYLHGVDLFNHGCYWEAHEAWEHRWLPLTEQQALRTYLQGLIQASASLLKLRLDQPSPARTIWKRGRNRLNEISADAPQQIYWGLEIPSFIESVDKHIDSQRSRFAGPQIKLIGWD